MARKRWNQGKIVGHEKLGGGDSLRNLKYYSGPPKANGPKSEAMGRSSGVTTQAAWPHGTHGLRIRWTMWPGRRAPWASGMRRKR